MCPKVSVLMSVYNGEKCIQESIDSILAQTFTDFEFIIINDGSTDKTKEILESYHDPRIRLFHQANIGLTKSLNKGIKTCNGKYIARMDADDISHKERLAMETGVLDSNLDIGLVGSHTAFIDDNGNQLGVWEPPNNHDEIVEGLMKENCFCHGSVMFRTKCIDKIGDYREFFKYTQDYDLWLRISDHFKVINIDKILYQFRRSANTISRKKLSMQLNYHLLAIELAKERRLNGVDSLKDIESDNVKSVLIKRYKLKNSDINTFKSNIFLVYFTEAIKTKDFIGAFNLWFRAFFFEPKKWKIRLFLKEISGPLLNNAS